MRLYHSQCNIAARMPLVGVVHVAPVSRGFTRSNAKGRSDLQAAKTLIPRKQSYSRYTTSDWCGLPAASSFPRHWRRCSDCQRGKYVRRSLDADWCRDQYHKWKPLKVAINALHRISCRTAPPSNLVYSLINEAEPGCTSIGLNLTGPTSDNLTDETDQLPRSRCTARIRPSFRKPLGYT